MVSLHSGITILVAVVEAGHPSMQSRCLEGLQDDRRCVWADPSKGSHIHADSPTLADATVRKVTARCRFGRG